MAKTKDALIMILFALAIAGGFIGVSFLSAWINYLIYKPLVCSVDPNTIQWFHWFLWSDKVVGAALFGLFPQVWWTVTIITSIAVTSVIMLWMISG